MKNPTPANPIHTSPHLATVMNNMLFSVFPAQVMEGYRPKTWVSQSHNLFNYVAGNIHTDAHSGAGSVVISKLTEFQMEIRRLKYKKECFLAKNMDLSWCVPHDGQLSKQGRPLRYLLDGL